MRAAAPIRAAARRRRWLKPAAFTAALVPLAAILLDAARRQLGADPVAEALNRLGLTALVFLVAALACTPLREILDWTWATGLRRMLGLFAFFYASLHFATYAIVDQGLRGRAIVADVTKRPFILSGFAAFLILVPLAATSTAAAVQRLGYARWKKLQRFAYLAGALAALHFWLRVKKDVREPAIYASVLGALLLARAYVAWRDARRRRIPRRRPEPDSAAPGR
ncbi:MAG TPA: protein-methionine-sulfoxide reductase heme-binding subunit MsrQ [Thermoanaerobaculia bacterium]|nr:protein-methionine-sulfoxide reductase heme-binding subunit MsrQ [Thermoanaerobaculia bacterium]